MTTLLERAKLLREEASDLEKQYEASVLPSIEAGLKDVIGSCYEIKERSGNNRWVEYVYVREIEDVYISPSGDGSVSLSCFRFALNRPYYGLYYVGYEQTYLHVLETYSKKITREKFNKKFLEFQEKILTNGYSV